MKIRAWLLASSVLLAGRSVAFATPIAYTSETAWLAAVAGVTTESFAASPLGQLPAGTTDIGQFSITIDVSDGPTQIADGGFVNGTREFQGYLGTGTTTGLIRFESFDAGPTIFGFAGVWNSTATADVLTATINGVTFNFSTLLGGSPGSGFVGFVDPTGFSSVSFGRQSPSGMGEWFALDDAQVATGVVPEPTTLLLFGTGLAAAGLRRYRRGTGGPR